MSSVGIVGAGAAGLMTAATLIEGGYEGTIVLYEKNKTLGNKVKISGGGRCNVTTGTIKRKELLRYYPRGSNFLDYAFRQFGPRQVRKWFEQHGVPLKEEDDGRIFPVSNNGGDVVGVFKRLFNVFQGITLATSMNIEYLQKHDQGYLLQTDGNTYHHTDIVLTTGGQAYAHTGSTGDGYAFARACGHTITGLGPSLNSFKTFQERHTSLSGTVFEDATITHPQGKAQGPVLLTHFGITGPGVFVLASQIPFVPVNKNTPYQMRLVPKQDMNYDVWTQRIQSKKITDPKQSIQKGLTQFFTKRTCEAVCKNYQWSNVTFATLTKLQMKAIADTLGNGIVFDLIMRRPGDEFVTAGGVVTDEVDPKTMESRLSPGLYMAGELLNVDGVTGGYNLQASRATGRMAGRAIVEKGKG